MCSICICPTRGRGAATASCVDCSLCGNPKNRLGFKHNFFKGVRDLRVMCSSHCEFPRPSPLPPPPSENTTPPFYCHLAFFQKGGGDTPTTITFTVIVKILVPYSQVELVVV